MGEIRDQFNYVYRDFQTDGIPASGLHEVEKSDVRTLGGVIEDETALYAAAAENAANVALQAAVTGQGTVHILATSVSAGGALPFEVTALSGSFVGTGTGGTPGEYALTVSGGPAGHSAFITIGGDGKIASARIGARGIATANTAPTYALPSGTGLTGGTLPTPTVSALAAGRIFLAASSDGRKLLGWQSSGGVTAAWSVGGSQYTAPINATLLDIDDLKIRLPAPFAMSITPGDDGTYSHFIVSENGFKIGMIERGTGKWMLGLSDNAPFPEGWQNSVLGGVQFANISDLSGFIGPVTDGAGNLLGGWKSDGTFKASLSPDSLIPEALYLAQITALLSAPAYLNSGVSGPAITCIGDSLTASAGSTGGNTYPAQLATLSGRTVNNLGVGGETARTIAGRVGGWPYMVTVSGGSIPTSGGVTVTLVSLDGQAVAPLVQGSTGLNPCSLLGVTGTLSYNSGTGVYTFTRTTAGTAVTAGHPVALVTDAQRNRMGDILIADLGQNGGFADDAQLIAMHDAIFQNQARANNLNLALGRTTSTLSARASLHDAMQRRYGARFVNVLAYLSSYAALARAGVTPTSGDDAAIAAGSCPPSFLSDAVHLNNAGYGQKAYIVYERLLQLGWI